MTEPKEQAVPVVGVEEAVERLTDFLSAFPKDLRFVTSVNNKPIRVADLRTILQALQGSSLRDPHRATEQPVVGWREALQTIRHHLVRVQGWEDDSDDDEQSGWNVYQRAIESIEAALVAQGWTRETLGRHLFERYARQTHPVAWERTEAGRVHWQREADAILERAFLAEEAASGEAALGGDEAEGGVHEKAQLKAAYEALERARRQAENSAYNINQAGVTVETAPLWRAFDDIAETARQALARRGEGA